MIGNDCCNRYRSCLLVLVVAVSVPLLLLLLLLRLLLLLLILLLLSTSSPYQTPTSRAWSHFHLIPRKTSAKQQSLTHRRIHDLLIALLYHAATSPPLTSNTLNCDSPRLAGLTTALEAEYPSPRPRPIPTSPPAAASRTLRLTPTMDMPSPSVWCTRNASTVPNPAIATARAGGRRCHKRCRRRSSTRGGLQRIGGVYSTGRRYWAYLADCAANH